MLVGVTSLWAADETITFSTLGLENGVQYKSFDGADNGLNFSLAFGDGSNDGKYYNTGTAIRVYSGGHMTVTSAKDIEKIELTFGSGDGTNAITTVAGTYSNGTWTGSAKSITFNVGGTSGHRRIASVAVTYASTKELSSIALSGTYTTTFVEGNEFNHDGVVVTATYSDNTTEDVTADATFNTPDMLQVGEQTVTVTYNGKTATYTINITEAPTHSVTFSVNGTATTADFKENSAIIFPTDPASINDYAFVGWSESELTAGETPTLVSSATMGNADKTFYAVFAICSPGTSNSVVDVLNNANTINETTTNYSAWSNVKSNSDAVYAGNSAGDNLSIQLRTNNSNSGVVSTTSGGKVTKVVVEWNVKTSDNRTLDVYGKNVAYTAASELYGENKGTKLGSLLYNVSSVTTTELTIDGDYEYIGIRSNSGALYLSKIEITWTSSTPDTYSDYCTTVPANKIDITVGDSKFTSVYYSNKALVVPTGLTAYTFKVNSDNKLEISETIATGETIAKDQAVILYGATGTYEMNVADVDGTKDANNILRGFDTAQLTTGGSVYYRLTTKGYDPSTIGFYWGAENGGAFTVGAHKAYVAVDTELTFGAGARMADLFSFGEATGISSMQNSQFTMSNEVYDLQGRRVAQPTKGLYIVNGKKMIMK